MDLWLALPGLWVAALGALLLFALKRWYDPVPWRAALAFGIALVALFGPVLFQGEILLPLDELRGEVPFRHLPPTEPHGNLIQGDLIQLVAPSQMAVRHALESGRWPLWNDRVGAGMPLLADPQAQAFQPLTLLALPFPLPAAAGVTAALRVLWALVFTFLFLRRLKLSEGPALAGALAFGLGGFSLLWLGWPMANSVAWLPAALYGVARLAQVDGKRDFALLVAALFGLLTGGHPETIAYALIVVAVFALGFRKEGRKGGPKDEQRPLQSSLLALVLALGLAAPVLLPALDLLPRSARAHRVSVVGEGSSVFRVGADEALARVVPLFAPNAFGNSRYVGYWGPSNTNEDAGGFVGTATLLLALAGASFFSTRKAMLGERWLAGISAVAIATAIVFGYQRLFLISSFGLACLAAVALERRGEIRKKTVIAAAVILGGLIVWGTLAHPNPGDAKTLELLRVGWLHWHGRMLVGGTLLLLVVPRWRWTAFAFAALIAGELWLAHRVANPPMPAKLAFPRTAATEFLAARVGQGQGARLVALGAAFPPNLPALWGLADARIYNPSVPWAWEDLTAPLIVERRSEVPRFGNPEHPLYARLGVRWFLVGPNETLPAPFRLAFEDPTARIYEGADPRAWFAGTARNPNHRAARLPSGFHGRTIESAILGDHGWRAVVDGLSTKTRTQGLLKVEIPSGAKQLDLVYRPRGWFLGWLLAALALAAWVAWAGGGAPLLGGRRGGQERGRG